MNIKTIKISKLDAARRQLDSAIRLWFSSDDPVTIHALVWAAYQIIQDINNKKGDKSITLLELTRSIVKPEHVEDAMRHLRKAMTFFKHANRDPHDILEFNPEESEHIMLLAIKGIESLGEQVSDVQRVFILWTNIHVPEYFDSSTFKDKLSPQVVQQMRSIKKPDFLEAGLLGLVETRLR